MHGLGLPLFPLWLERRELKLNEPKTGVLDDR